MLVSEKKPLVSVIVPVYKVEPYLENCVNSVLNQTYSNINIVLVDDGSPDNCPAICDDLANKHQCIHVVHKENGGLSSARNAGILAADKDTDYVVFLDSDDTMPLDAIEGLVNQAVNEGADVVIPDRYHKVYENSDVVETTFHFPESKKISDPKAFVLDVLIAEGRAWRSTAVLYSYKLIIESGVRYPEGYLSEDFTFNVNLLPYANKISFCSISTLNNLKRKGSISSGYRENLDKDIWFIDKQANAFLEKYKLNDSVAVAKVNSLLCRNIFVNIISLMTTKNIGFRKKEIKAKEILYSPNSRLVWQKKNPVPFFESKSAVIMLKVCYFLFRIRMVSFGLWLLHMYSKIK